MSVHYAVRWKKVSDNNYGCGLTPLGWVVVIGGAIALGAKAFSEIDYGVGSLEHRVEDSVVPEFDPFKGIGQVYASTDAPKYSVVASSYEGQ